MPRPPVDRISWGEDLPPRQIPVIDLVIPRPGEPVKGWILAPQILMVMTHWWCERTVPHVKPRELCEPCTKGRHRPRWNGFFPIVTAKRQIQIAQLTEEAARKNPTLRDKSVDLRGWQIELVRSGPSERSEVKVGLHKVPATGKLPPGPDILPVLLNTWGWHLDTRLDDLGESSGPPDGGESYPTN